MSPSASDRLRAILEASDFFEMLGMPRAHAIDRETLESTYLELAGSIHPDRFAMGSTSEQRQAHEASSALNVAYRTLRDPVTRAEYLVALGGIELDSSDPDRGAPTMDQTFLLSMIDRREAVAEARAKGFEALGAYRDQTEQECEDAVLGAVACLDSGDVKTAAEHLIVRRYLRRLLDEIDEDIEV